MTEISFTVPLVPPSVNHYRIRTAQKGRFGQAISFESGEAKAYKKAVVTFARGLKVEAEAYEVKLKIFLGKKGKGDVDNFAKIPLDGLVAAGVIHSDAAIILLTIEKFRDWAEPRTEITVRAYIPNGSTQNAPQSHANQLGIYTAAKAKGARA